MSSKGWLYNLDPELNPYFARKDEITLQSGCLMWEIRDIVPPKLRPLARSYIWWPGVDKEIELTVKSRSVCQLTLTESTRYSTSTPMGVAYKVLQTEMLLLTFLHPADDPVAH